MHIAAMTGQTDFFKQLLQKAKDKNPGDDKEKTPLHYAAEKGHSRICRMILDTNIKDKNPDSDKSQIETPLHLATWNNHASICRLIFKRAGVKNPYDKNDTSHGGGPYTHHYR